jgi:hypothetical protein
MMRHTNKTLGFSLISLAITTAACSSEVSDIDSASSEDVAAPSVDTLTPEEEFSRLHIVPPVAGLEQKAPDSLDRQLMASPPSTRAECSMYLINNQNQVATSSSQTFTVPSINQNSFVSFDFGIGGAGNGTLARFFVQGFDQNNIVAAVTYSFGGSASAITSHAVAVLPKWTLLVPGSSALANGIVLTPQNAPVTVGSFNNITQVSFSCTSLGI